MADHHCPQVRSYNMSRIRSTNSKPEKIVRKFLFSKGFRYRKNDKRFIGKPDIVLPKYKAIIFVHGCFWHMHEGNPCFRMPKTRREYWEPKLKRNYERDIKNIEKLRAAGWYVIVIWECELKPKHRDKRLSTLLYEILVQSKNYKD